jgi:dihydroflavonol-4-reductase
MGQIILDCIRRKPQFYVDGAYDFVDVRDVADGLILLSTRGRTGQTYILSGEALSVKSLMDNVREISGGRFLQIKIPMPLAELAAKFCPFYYHLARIKPRLTPYALATITSNPMISHEKAERELGYHPRSIFQSIQDAVYWFLQTRQRTQRPEAMV